ncbi:hypothetical protein J6590_040331 [Homalodisca vitripennis]|nr:hypothetical protein J6590_040331 [Homalodisca vitripennis]
MRTLSLSPAPIPLAASPATPALSSDADLPASPATSIGASIPAVCLDAASAAEVADLVAENKVLQDRLLQLEEQFKHVLDHSIESDTRLLQYTNQVFVASTSRVDSPVRPSATDCGVQCDLPTNCGDQRCAETRDLVASLRTTIEVLEAELKCFRGKEECGCTGEQPPDWTVKHDKRRSCVMKPVNQPSTVPKLLTCSLATSEGLSSPCSERMKKKKNKNGRKRKTKPTDEDPRAELPYSSVLIEGDSHTRDLAKHVRRRITWGMKVEDFCKPGAGLLDATSQVSINQEIVLVNHYIEELCARYRGAGVLDFNRIGRSVFTRHGMHLRPDNKHLLAELLVECLQGANRFIRVTPSPPAPLLSALGRPVAAGPHMR